MWSTKGVLVWFSHHIVEGVAVGRTRSAGIRHLNAGRVDAGVRVTQRDEYALAVTAVARRKTRDGLATVV